MTKVILARARDLEALERFEMDGKASYKDRDWYTLRDFQKHHTRPGRLILIAQRNDRSIAGYLATRSRLSDILICGWNASKKNGDSFNEDVLKLLVRKLAELPSSLMEYRRKILTVYAREQNTQEQLFWKSVGFRCEKIVHNHFDCPPDTAYRFHRRRGASDDAGVPAEVVMTPPALTHKEELLVCQCDEELNEVLVSDE